MLVTNLTNQDYWFGPLHIDPLGTLTVDDTSEQSLYRNDDTVADAINNLYASGKVTVSGQAQPFPRATGIPQLLHGDGSPDGRLFAPQGSAYMRRDNTGASSSLYVKTTGITLSTGWQPIMTDAVASPTGVILQYGGSAAPTDWLLCDGAAVSRTSYAALYGVIGTSYGTGDGSTTFNVPDLRGRSAVGLGTNAAVNALGKSDGVTVGNRRGSKHRHTPHSHTINAYDTGSGAGGAAGTGNSGNQALATIASSDGGSGNASDPLDGGAFLVVNYIIKT